MSKLQPDFSIHQYDEAVQAIHQRTAHQPTVGLILGSGLSPLADQVTDPAGIAYDELPHFPVSTVEGHAGRMILGKLAGKAVCVMQGRFHYYEGYSLQQTTFPVRVMQRMGIHTLIVTNAAGGLNPDFSVGDLMLIEDHINFPGFAGQNPLRGPNLDEFGPRFPAANHIYTPRLRKLAHKIAAAHDIPLQHGVYAMLGGPNFETPAEIRLLRQLGVDAVGMSTVPETLVAHHAGMEVLAFSTITNIAIDQMDTEAQPSHEEVQEAGHLVVPRLSRMILGVLDALP